MIRGMLPPSERETYQIHMPWRSNGVAPATGGSPSSPAPPGSADAAGGIETIESSKTIASSARREPGTEVHLALTKIPNTLTPNCAAVGNL